MTRNSLRLVFMGTPDFAVPVLAALLDAGHDVVGVFTQPDRRSGRGRRLSAPPVKEFAESRDLTVFQPVSLREDAEARQRISDLAPDSIVVAAYGLFLPEETLAVPQLGCLNIHPSLLPQHRGPSPVATAILEGDETTGVTIMLLDEGMDTGPILNQSETSISADEPCDQLTARLFDVGANLLTETLDLWSNGSITPTPQDDASATVTRRLQRSDGRIDWNDTAESIARRVRAFTPWPGTFTTRDGRTFKVIRAESVAATFDVSAGSVVTLSCSDGIGVATGCGILRLLEVQVEGRRASAIKDFVRGYPDFVGSKLDD